MAVSWSFALLLILTLVALITFSQPLFQSTPAAEVRHTREDLEIAPQQNLPTFKARESSTRESNIVGRSQRQHRTRKVTIQRGEELQQKQGICRGKRKTILQRKTFSSTTDIASERHPPAARNAIPRRSVSAHFESDRMVPTGPNPLHNSNRSQVIFP